MNFSKFLRTPPAEHLRWLLLNTSFLCRGKLKNKIKFIYDEKGTTFEQGFYRNTCNRKPNHFIRFPGGLNRWDTYVIFYFTNVQASSPSQILFQNSERKCRCHKLEKTFEKLTFFVTRAVTSIANTSPQISYLISRKSYL